jgi:hypothetical protein
LANLFVHGPDVQIVRDVSRHRAAKRLTSAIYASHRLCPTREIVLNKLKKGLEFQQCRGCE